MKTNVAIKSAADSRNILAKIEQLITEEGGTCKIDIGAKKCSHASIVMKDGERFRILVEAR